MPTTKPLGGRTEPAPAWRRYGQQPCCCAVFAALCLTGCNWVDSAGSDEDNRLPQLSVSSDAPSVPLPTDEPGVVDDDTPADDGAGTSATDAPLVLSMSEDSRAMISVQGEDPDGQVQSYQWSESPVSAGDIEACAQVNGFDPVRATDSLETACTLSGCELTFDRIVADADSTPGEEATGSDDGAASAEAENRNAIFEFTVPMLRAPVGVTYELQATDDRGGTATTPVSFCLVSINEAPEAVDDSFSVLEGSVLEVTSDTLNLLSNDEDDVDTSNEPLSVLTDAARPPAAATVFDLQTDGGFTYAFTGASLTSDIIDSFDYTVTDGTFTSTATATVRIVQRDDPPELTGSIPPLGAVEGLTFDVDLATFFEDPEGADLGFDVVAGELPPSGELVLSPLGELAGTPAAGDAGEYAFTVAASDGVSAAEADLTLSVLANESITTRPIPRQIGAVGERIRFGVARFFTDPEGVSLRFRLSTQGAALNLTIDTRSGVITGFARDAGTYRLTITADDGFTTPVTGTVVLVVAE